jgi:hypothetical protein
MYASIQVTISRGHLANPQHLVSIARAVSKNVVMPRTSGGPLSYVEQMVPDCTYACAPLRGSLAVFDYEGFQHFSVVIETVTSGNLIRISENVVDKVLSHLARDNMEADIEVLVWSPLDQQAYIVGNPQSVWMVVGERLTEFGVFLVFGVIMAIVARIWLEQYFQESLAGLLYLTLVTGWKMFQGWNEVRRRPIRWRVLRVGETNEVG